ncbi:uncharacterized protein LOC143291545 [Babylonia areolata]|uniref:uncharacterized protein LOC143291545 n=1 Tax=Babylonia areolata TaxID=304850 RepID=UPI003FCF74D3
MTECENVYNILYRLDQDLDQYMTNETLESSVDNSSSSSPHLTSDELHADLDPFFHHSAQGQTSENHEPHPHMSDVALGMGKSLQNQPQTKYPFVEMFGHIHLLKLHRSPQELTRFPNNPEKGSKRSKNSFSESRNLSAVEKHMREFFTKPGRDPKPSNSCSSPEESIPIFTGSDVSHASSSSGFNAELDSYEVNPLRPHGMGTSGGSVNLYAEEFSTKGPGSPGSVNLYAEDFSTKGPGSPGSVNLYAEDFSTKGPGSPGSVNLYAEDFSTKGPGSPGGHPWLASHPGDLRRDLSEQTGLTDREERRMLRQLRSTLDSLRSTQTTPPPETHNSTASRSQFYSAQRRKPPSKKPTPGNNSRPAFFTLQRGRNPWLHSNNSATIGSIRSRDSKPANRANPWLHSNNSATIGSIRSRDSKPANRANPWLHSNNSATIGSVRSRDSKPTNRLQTRYFGAETTLPRKLSRHGNRKHTTSKAVTATETADGDIPTSPWQRQTSPTPTVPEPGTRKRNPVGSVSRGCERGSHGDGNPRRGSLREPSGTRPSRSPSARGGDQRAGNSELRRGSESDTVALEAVSGETGPQDVLFGESTVGFETADLY